ncbi:MAG: hypothetical protein KatS3mg105_2773 [Gemmatales bacterium]|nr:MAG: hypothetical protein KatS3mg105_2773 [Gemmatales bacterium]
MSSSPYRIAIVGVGAIFPGSLTISQFWQNVRDGVDTSCDVPSGRWLLSPEDAFHANGVLPDRVYSKRGCYIEGFRLNADGLNVDADLVSRLDPMFHLVLHAGKQAWDSAVTHNIDRNRVGIVFGNIVLPTEKSSELAREILGPTFLEKLFGSVEPRPFRVEPLNRFVAGLPALLLGRALGLKGGSHTLDAACASSLYALKLACDELQSGRADAMLAGGLSRPDCLYTQMGFLAIASLVSEGALCPL